MGRLHSSVAIITGGGSGIGRAVVERFLEEGASVGVLDRTSTEPFSDPGRTVVTLGDVTSYHDNCRVVQETVAAFGRLDVFVGNAGVYDGGMRLVDVPESALGDAFDGVFAVNVKGYLFGARAALPHVVRSGGCMIFTVSNSGFYAGGGGPLYTASKHAVMGVVRQLAHELAPHVRVNGVAPGGTVTGLRGPAALGQDDRPVFGDSASWEDRIRASKPLDFAPGPADHAGAYVFLASRRDSGALTGEVLRSDGGLRVRGLDRPAAGHDLTDLFGTSES